MVQVAHELRTTETLHRPMDFFSALLPGALLTYLLMGEAGLVMLRETKGSGALLSKIICPVVSSLGLWT